MALLFPANFSLKKPQNFQEKRISRFCSMDAQSIARSRVDEMGLAFESAYLEKVIAIDSLGSAKVILWK